MSQLSEDDITTIRTAVRAELDDRGRIDGDLHAAHHRYIENQIKRDSRRAETREKIKQQVIGWGIAAAIVSAGTAIYQHTVATLTKAVGK